MGDLCLIQRTTGASPRPVYVTNQVTRRWVPSAWVTTLQSQLQVLNGYSSGQTVVQQWPSARVDQIPLVGNLPSDAPQAEQDLDAANWVALQTLG